MPKLGFKHMTQFEDMGFGIVDIMQKNKTFSLYAGIVGVVVGCGREEAERLCEQHVLGGGTFEDITTKFMQAMDESAFFKKLLNIGEEKNNSKAKTTEE